MSGKLKEKRLCDYPEVLQQKDVAELFGVSIKTVQNWTVGGKISYIKIGNTTRYLLSEIIGLSRKNEPPVVTGDAAGYNAPRREK